MITKKLKTLIEKMGGDPTGVKTKAQAIDCLCNCEMSGGNSPLIVELYDSDEDGYTPSVTWQEAFEALMAGRNVYLHETGLQERVVQIISGQAVYGDTIDQLYGSRLLLNTDDSVGIRAYRWYKDSGLVTVSGVSGTLNSNPPPM